MTGVMGWEDKGLEDQKDQKNREVQGFWEDQKVQEDQKDQENQKDQEDQGGQEAPAQGVT